MPENVLLTGVSGYLGGTLLARYDPSQLSNLGNTYALVRTPEQAKSVEKYNVMPLLLDTSDVSEVKKAIIDREISIIFFLIDAVHSATQVAMIEALSDVHRRTGKNVHFLHTSGAKIFSSHAGHPVDAYFYDNEPRVYELQHSRKGHLEMVNQAIETNNAVIEASERYGVQSYIFVPCIVYGEGEGFGKRISLQTTAIVRAAKALGQVYRPHSGNPVWPVSHILDTTSLYLQILQQILNGNDIEHGRTGYFLAASGHVAWEDIYAAMAKRLVDKKTIAVATIEDADEAVMERMGQALGCPKEYVALQLGGQCMFAPAHGKLIGWEPQFPPEHILESAATEVDLILQALG